MKNLANCKPSEFLKQTNRIRKSVEKWLDINQVMEIRKHLPQLADDMTEEEKEIATQKQGRKNLRDIMDSAMEKHPDETLELLALLCFVEPQDVDKYPVTDYMDAFNEIISNQSVLSFFISLARLAQTDI